MAFVRPRGYPLNLCAEARNRTSICPMGRWTQDHHTPTVICSVGIRKTYQQPRHSPLEGFESRRKAFEWLPKNRNALLKQRRR